MPKIRVNNIGLEYVIKGEGIPIICIGALDLGIDTWLRFYSPRFNKNNFRTILYNPRGMPPSDIPEPPYSIDDLTEDVNQLIDALKIESCYVIGTSLGALVAQELTIKRPDAVKKLCLVWTFGRKTVWFRALCEGELEIYKKKLKFPRLYIAAMDMLQCFPLDYIQDDEKCSKTLDSFLKHIDYASKGRYGLFSATTEYDNRLDTLSGIKAKSLVIAFEKDVLTPYKLSKEVADVIPNSEFYCIKDAGHLGIFTHAEEVFRLALDFFLDHEIEQ